MTTNSKGNCSRHFTICRAVSYCGSKPVPLSPITAKRTDFGLSGSSRLAADPAAAISRMEIRRRMVSRDGVDHEIDDQAGLRIAQHQAAAHHPIIQFLGQLGQVEQERWRHGL